MNTLVLLAWLVASPAAAQPAVADEAAAGEGEAGVAEEVVLAPARAVATVRGPDPAWVGQMVEIDVALYRDARGDNPGAHFSEPNVRGAIAMKAAWAPPPTEERIDGERFLVQRRRYLVFPQRDGAVRVRPISIRWTEAGSNEPTVLATEQVRFGATHPERRGDDVILVAEGVTVEQTISPDLGSLRVGDAFTREVTIRARGTDATLLPAVTFPDVSGLAVYPAEATSRTNVSRGQFTATRTERATYVVVDWGLYALAPVEVRWLAPSSGETSVARADAVAFRGRINPSLGLGCFGSTETVTRRGTLFALLALLVWAIGLGIRRWRRRLAARRTVARSSEEKRRWRALVEAAKSGLPLPTLRATYDWLASSSPRGRSLTLRALRSAAPRTVPATRALETQLYRDDERDAMHESALVAELRSYRNSHRDDDEPALPSLNCE